MLKEEAEKIDKYCKEKNISKNGLFKQAVFEKMELFFYTKISLNNCIYHTIIPLNNCI